MIFYCVIVVKEDKPLVGLASQRCGRRRKCRVHPKSGLRSVEQHHTCHEVQSHPANKTKQNIQIMSLKKKEEGNVLFNDTIKAGKVLFNDLLHTFYLRLLALNIW